MKNQLKAGVVLQYLQMGLNALIQLVYTPFILRILGQSEYGIYNLASTIISYLSLLSFGFGTSYIRFYSRYKKEGEEQSIAQLNGLFMLVFLLIGLIALGIGLLFSFNVGTFFNESFTVEETKTATILMIFMSIFMALSFPTSVFTSYVSSQEKFVFQKTLNLGKTVIAPLATLPLLLLGYGSIGMVLVTTVIAISIDLANCLYCILHLKMKFQFKKLNFRLLKEIAIFSSFIAINMVAEQINTSVGSIILGRVRGPEEVAVYGVANTINSTFINIGFAISGVFAPRINRIVAGGEEDCNLQLSSLMNRVGRIMFIVLVLPLTGFIFFGKYFVNVWAGEGYQDAYYVIVIYMCATLFILCQTLGMEIQRAKNKHQFRSIVYLVMAVINVVISIFLCRALGAIGAAIGLAISLIVAKIIALNIYYHKKLGLNVWSFWKEMLKFIPALILPVAFGVILMIFVEFTTWWIYLLCMLAYVVIYAVSMWFLGMNKSEKSMLLSVKGLLKKKRPAVEQSNESND